MTGLNQQQKRHVPINWLKHKKHDVIGDDCDLFDAIQAALSLAGKTTDRKLRDQILEKIADYIGTMDKHGHLTVDPRFSDVQVNELQHFTHVLSDQYLRDLLDTLPLKDAAAKIEFDKLSNEVDAIKSVTGENLDSVPRRRDDFL